MAYEISARLFGRGMGFAAILLLLPMCNDAPQDDDLDADAAQTDLDAELDGEDDADRDASGDVLDSDVIDPAAVILFADGMSQHRIVLQPGASPSERHAADELQTYFSASTGVTLPIIELSSPDDEPMIVVGRGPVAQSLDVDPTDEELGDQGFLIETSTPHVVIAGTAQAGTLYGVHRFVEDTLGVRWLAPNVTNIPQHVSVIAPPTSHLEQPAFLWRHTSYEWPGGDGDFRARMGDNVGSGGPDNPQGNQYDGGGAAHTYLRFVHPDEFFDEHPEYFSEIGGRRIREETQLCLTNPDVLDIVAERMLAQMADDPSARQHTFSQMDYYNQCQCEHCREINERYQTPGGTQYWFVNQLAERTAEVYPDKLIRTLAYMYTEEPPVGLEMHPNTSVWLCHMYPSCDSHPIDTCPLDADYHRRALAWADIVDHLYVWHYIVDFTHYYAPFPNFRAMAADMRFYRDIGVEGVFLQGMGARGGGGEFSLLRPYYGLKLLWNPDRDADALIDEFLEGYYDDASAPIREYIDLIHDKVEDENIHMHLYTNPAQGYLPDSIVEQAETLFDQAEAAVEHDEELLERVRVARMPLVYARLFPRHGYEIRGSTLHWLGLRATFTEITDFIDRMTSHGFETVREFDGGTDTVLLAYMLLGADQSLVRIENPHLSVEVVPNLAGRALRIIERSTGECVTAYNVKQGLFFPFSGGLEDRVGGMFRFFGWVEPATVIEKTDTSIAVELQTFNGLVMRRRIELHPTEPVLIVESTAVNPGDSAEEVRLRNHLELDMGDVATTRVRFTNRDGETIDQDMSAVIAGMRLGQYFYDQYAPADEWTFTGSEGLRLTQRFDDDDLDFAWLVAFPESLDALEVELWGHEVMLEAGESVTLRQEIEIRVVE